MHLSTRLILSLILISAVLMGVIGMLSVNEERAALQSSLREQGNAIARSIAAYSVEPLASGNYSLLETGLQAIARENSNLLSIEVSRGGKVVASFGNSTPDNSLALHADVYLHAMKKQQLGEVRLLVSERGNAAIIAASIKNLIIHIFLALTLLGLIMRYMLDKLIIRPGEQLKPRSERVITAELPEKLEPPALHHEIDVLHERIDSTPDELQPRDNPRVAILEERDINDRQAAQNRLLKLNESLEELVEQHTRELHHTKQMAESADKAKNEFLANMSHEIRTPMNSILGMTYLALYSVSDPKIRDYLEKIQSSGLHLLSIIDDILDFSKLSAGKLNICKVDFNLGGVLEDVTDLISAKATAKGLELVTDNGAGLGHDMRGDPHRITQVLVNYVTNAIKFTENGRITIRTRKIDENETSCMVHFEVQNRGVGISNKDKSGLFQPFWQLDALSARKYEGAGMSLAICKQLVEMMPDGEVGVESTLGQGCTFWFKVRLEKAVQTCQPDNGTPPQLPATIKGARILLAENNLFNLQVVVELLKNAGAILSIASNGQEAADLLTKDEFDCVLMDVQMPVMNGLDATRLIRANPDLAMLPVIAMTANTSGEDRERCLAAGMNDFIGKPFTPHDFYNVIARWLATPSAPCDSSAETCAEAPVSIDLSVLAELFGGNRQKMREFALKFLASVRLEMVKLEAALKHNDLAALSALGHHIGGPSGLVGAKEFAGLCKTLEIDCKDGESLEQVQDIINRMSLMLESINQQVNKELA